MNRTHRFTAFALAATIGAGVLAFPITAKASEAGKRNTAIGLGAAAVGLLLTQKNKLPGIVAGVGAAYAYSQYNNSVQNRHRDERYYGYDNRDNRSRDDRSRNYNDNNDNNYRRDDNRFQNNHSSYDNRNRDNNTTRNNRRADEADSYFQRQNRQNDRNR